MGSAGAGNQGMKEGCSGEELMAGATVGLIHLQLVISPLATQLLTWRGIERQIKLTELFQTGRIN